MLIRLVVVTAFAAWASAADSGVPDCPKVGDGYYVTGCSSKFYRCVSDRLYSYECPHTLKFDPLRRKCDYKANVQVCGEGVQQDSRKVIKASAEFNCTGLADGSYKPHDIDCSNTFITCFNGVAAEMACPFDQFYHPGEVACDYKERVPGCLSTPEVNKPRKGSKIGGSLEVSGAGSPPAPPPRQPAPANINIRVKAAQLNACPGLLTGRDGIPCEDDEVCQSAKRPRNGRYSCEAPFSIWYGPLNGPNAQWIQAKDALVCGADGFWYDNGKKVTVNAIDCTAPKTAFVNKKQEDLGSCPSLSTDEKEIPCAGDIEVCHPIQRVVNGKYACATPFTVWYGPRSGDHASWKQAKDALICKNGAWFDGDVKIEATAVDCTVQKIDCSKLGDGAYNGEPGRCSTHFWQCANDQAFLYPCPPGLFFDDFSKACDYKEAVESCGGARRLPESVSTTTATSTEMAADVPKTDCPSLITDASLPCNAGDSCIAPTDPVNNKYRCETPYTLWFGPKSNANQWRQAHDSIECRAGRWFNAEEPISPEAVHCTTLKFACAGKPDGMYTAHSDKCTDYFWNCAHDDSFLYRCPSGLFFDIDSNSCDYKEVVVSCGGVKKNAHAAATELVPSNDSPYFDCSTKQDGYQESGKCQKTFWNCADRKAFKMDCPEGLVYDGRVQACQYPTACESELPATIEPATLPPSALDHGSINETPAPKTTTFDCTNKSDGQYAEKKCHKQYAECTNGRVFAKECPAGLVFVQQTLSCDYKATCMNVPPSTEAPTATTQTPSAAEPAAVGYATYERKPSAPATATRIAPILPVAADKPNCSNLENGAHAMSRCGQDFFLCWNGETSFSKCSDGLFFNTLTSQCDYRSNVIECGAAPAADAATTTHAAENAGPPAPPTPLTTVAPDLFCEGRADDAFASGCQAFFYICKEGTTYKMYCPLGLFYDDENKQCDQRETIVACGAKRAVSTTISPMPALDSSSYTRVQPTTPPAVKTVNNLCMGKVDGFYGAGCQEFFYSCQEEIFYKMACPTGLFYDEVSKACDNREDVVACGGSRPTSAATEAPTPEPIARPTINPANDIPLLNFCAGKTDGFYSNGCQSFFYSCQSEATYKMTCPSGLYYNSVKMACDNREEIVACGAAPTVFVADAPVTPANTQTPVTPSTYVAPEIAKVADPSVTISDNFCTGKEDGYYGAGCQNFFYSCHENVAYKTTCSSDLFYDVDEQLCNYRESIVACGGKKDIKIKTIAPLAPALDKPVAIENFCLGKEDGFYGVGCNNYFFSCQASSTYKMACPSGLFYDTTQKACDRREDVVDCRSFLPTSSIAAAPVILPAVPATPYVQTVVSATVAPLRDLPMVPAAADAFCTGKKDGLYINGCQSFFYSCQRGATFKMACPTGLFYDGASAACDIRENVVACGGKRPIIAAPNAPLSRDQPAPPVDNFCSGKIDGFYGQACAVNFYSCAAGVTYKMLCPAGLFYDGTTQMCDVKERVVACGGAAAAALPQPPVVAPVSFVMNKQQQNGSASPPSTSTPSSRDVLAAAAPVVPIVPVTPATSVDKFCTGKADGIFPQGCSGFYYSCQSGYTYKMVCPAGLFYNAPGKRCDNRENIVSCGGQQLTQLASATQQSVPMVAASPAATSPTMDNFCIGKVDGIYTNGCQNFFYHCQNGITYKMACPAGLFYDVGLKGCEARENVVACGGQRQLAQPQTTTTAVAPLPAEPASYQTKPEIASAPAAPVTTTDNFCTGKIDGIYTNGCQDFFYQCQNGITYKMACPAGLFYDVGLKSCEARENVVACGGQRQPQPHPSTYQTTSPITSADPVIPIDNFCTGKMNGIYGNACQSYFYSCANGIINKMACGTGLFFDSLTNQCQLREAVEACGGVVAAAPTVSAANYGSAPTMRPTSAAPPAPPPSTYSNPVADKPTIITDKSCAGQQDGFRGESGCNEFFYSCLNEVAYKMACPTGLFYDASLQSCEYKDNVPQCGGRRVEVIATPSPVLEILPRAPATSTECIGKKDGIYTVGPCSQEFIVCHSELVRREVCQDALIYNGDKVLCDYRENVATCTGRDILPTRAPAATLNADYARGTSRPIKQDPYKQAHQKQTKPALTPSGTSCSALSDGYYANGCSSDYLACVSGQSMAMHCPAGLRYSVSSQMCDYADNVPECGGSVPVVAKDAAVISPRPYTQEKVTPVISIVKDEPRIPPPTAKPSKEVHPRCAGRINGIYALAPCSQNYIACVDEKATIGICRDDLYYNSASGLCDWQEKNQACRILVQPTSVTSRSVPATTTPVPATISRAVVPPAVSAERLISPTVPLGVNIDCSQLADGVYAVNSCSYHYSRCQRGSLIARGSCPRGLVFSPVSHSCVQKSDLTSCSSNPVMPAPTTPQEPLAQSPSQQQNYGLNEQSMQQQRVYQQQQQQSYGYQKQQLQQQYAPAYSSQYNQASSVYADPNQFCYGKSDGIYGNTCQRSYVICQQGATFGFQCPNEFLFYRERGVCDHPLRMPQCGASATFGYTAAAAAVSAPRYHQQHYTAY